MSGFIVSDTHVDALLTAGLHKYNGRDGDSVFWNITGVDGDPEQRTLSQDNASQVGAILLAENQRSVNSRYHENVPVGIYEFQELPGTPEPTTVLNAIRCYRYQSCEHDGWEASEAAQVVGAIESKMIRELCENDNTWEINDPDVFKPVEPEAKVVRGFRR
ncbi:MAG: hypothetical protein ACYCU8_07500 [Ferrimicrobium acidiphilum]